MHKKRKNYTSREKVSILKEHLLDKVPASDLCDKYGLHPSVFYRWQKEFFEKSVGAFDNPRHTHMAKLENKVKDLEEKLSRKNEILAELIEEHVTIKKALMRSESSLSGARPMRLAARGFGADLENGGTLKGERGHVSV